MSLLRNSVSGEREYKHPFSRTLSQYKYTENKHHTLFPNWKSLT